MQRQPVRVVDAFADEPTGGRAVGFDPDGTLSETQRRRVANELGTSGVVTVDGDEITYTDADGTQAVVSAATAATAGPYSYGELDPGTFEIDAGETCAVELDRHGTVTVDLSTAEPEAASVGLDWIADAIDIDVAAMEDVGADLPPARVGSSGGTLLAPVNFLEHVSGASPDRGTLAHLLESADCQRLLAVTFDTLAAETDLHARVFDPDARNCERGASGVGVAASAAHLAEHAVFDGEREEIGVESGMFVGRPSTVRATVEAEPNVGGTALTTLEGEVAVPDEEDDEIIEV